MAVINHYQRLGLPAEGGSQLTLREIEKAYRIKALELHPDKRPNDPNAHSNFQNLQFSYNFLKDDKSRKSLDDHLLQIRREQQRRSYSDSKRRKMMSDLHQRESFAPDLVSKAKEAAEKKTVEKFRQEIDKIRRSVVQAKKNLYTCKEKKKENLEVEKVMEVSWEGYVDDYSQESLKELFKQFGEVEYVVTPSVRSGVKRMRRWRSLVAMKSEEDAVSALGSVCGDLNNPLLVLPIFKASKMPSRSQVDPPVVHEASILEKLRKAAEKQTDRP